MVTGKFILVNLKLLSFPDTRFPQVFDRARTRVRQVSMHLYDLESDRLTLRDSLNLGRRYFTGLTQVSAQEFDRSLVVDTVVLGSDPLCTHSSCWDHQLMMAHSYICHWELLWRQGIALPKITPLPRGSLWPRTGWGGDANAQPPCLHLEQLCRAIPASEHQFPTPTKKHNAW